MASIAGRERELAVLRESLDRARSGTGSAVVVLAGIGMGKTRLVSEVVGIASEMGFTIMKGGCTSGTGRPFHPFSAALGEDVLEDESTASFSAVVASDSEGRPIAGYRNGQADDLGEVANIISVVQQFIGDTFLGGKGAGLGGMEYGGRAVLVEHRGGISVIATFEGAEHPRMREALKACAAEASGGDTGEALRRLSLVRFKVRRGIEGLRLESERLRIAGGIFERLREKSSEAPILLALEDLHWADESSIFALRYLARNVTNLRVLLVATARSDEGKGARTAIEAMRQEGTATTLELGLLDEAGVRVVVDSLLSPNSFPDGFHARLHRESGGNPFFVTELVKQMVSDGVVVTSDGRYALVREDFSLPASLSELVDGRLSVLSTEAMSLAEYASCIGREFDLLVVRSMRGHASPDEALAEMERSGIAITRAGAGEFAHAFFRDTIYENITPRWRAMHHRNLGEHYERAHSGNLEDVAYELAWHFSKTQDHTKAADYCVMAGDKAESAFAPEQMVTFYLMAFEAVGRAQSHDWGSSRIMAANEKLGDALTLLGRFPEAESRYAKALDMANGDIEKARLHRKTGEVMERRGAYDDARRRFEAGLSVLQGKGDRETGRLMMGMASILRRKGDMEAALMALGDAEKVFSLFPETTTDLVDVLVTRGIIEWRRGNLERALESMVMSHEVAMHGGTVRDVARTKVNLANVKNDLGDVDDALRLFGEALAVFKKIGDVQSQAILLNNLGSMHSDAGRLDQAMDLYHQSLETRRRIGDRKGIAYTLNNIGNQLKLKGDFENALARFIESRRILEEIGDMNVLPVIIHNIADCHAAMGNAAEAWKLECERLEMDKATKNRVDEASALLDMAVARLNDGAIDEALGMAREGFFILEEMGNAIVLAMGHRTLGMCLREKNDFSGSSEHFREARAKFVELKADRDLAMTLFEEALLLLRMGKRDEGLAELSEAESRFNSMGMRHWASKCVSARGSVAE